MWRFVLFILLCSSGLTPASAQIFDTDYDYAVIEVTRYTASRYTEKDRADRDRKANEDHKRKYPDSDDIVIVRSNSCGKGMVEFKTLQASAKTKPSLKMNYRLGEWCRQRYQLGDVFLAALHKGKIAQDSLFPLIEHAEDDWVLHIDPEALLELQSEGIFPLALKYKSYDPPLDDIQPFDYDPDYTYHMEMTQRRSDLDIRIEDGEKYIVVTRAIPVSSLIPDTP